MAKSRLMDFLVKLATDPEARRRYDADDQREGLLSEAKLTKRELAAIRSQDAKRVSDTFGTQAAAAKSVKKGKAKRPKKAAGGSKSSKKR